MEDNETSAGVERQDTRNIQSLDAGEIIDEKWASLRKIWKIYDTKMLDDDSGRDNGEDLGPDYNETQDIRRIIIESGRKMEVPRKLYEKPLDPSRQEIRLLSVLPLAKEGDIYIVNITMIIMPLTEGLAYHALSYVWGEASWLYEESFLKVFVNGYPVHVTWNLASALSHMASRGLEDLLWVDALCINQEDEEEKSQQVRLMGEIYKQASMTRVWLGWPYDNAQLAMDVMMEAEEHVEQNHDGRYFKRKGIPQTPLADWFAEKHADEAYREHWKALARLCQRSYWTRCWIVQEIVLSENVFLFCGELSVNIQALFAILREILVHRGGNFMEHQNLMPYILHRYPGSLRSAWRSHRTVKSKRYLYDNLLTFRDHKCSQKRDRFYSLLGITKPYTGAELPVDYQIDETEVYIQVVKYIIEGTGNLDILCECRPRVMLGDERNLQSLPSWVTDWHPRDSAPQFFRRRSQKYAKAGGEQASKIAYIKGGKVLVTNAIIIGPIHHLMQVVHLETMEETVGKLRQVIDYVITDGLARLEDSVSALRKDQLLKHQLTMLRRTIYGYHSDMNMMDKNWPLEQFALLAEREEKVIWLERSTLLNPFSWTRFALDDTNIVKINMRCGLRTSHHDQVFGIASTDVRVGDIVAVIIGCAFPLVLRPEEKSSHYTIVGQAIIDGLMNEEALGCEKETIYIQ